MDTLSIILRGVHIEGRVTNTATVSAPWGLSRDRGEAAVFHVVASGACWLEALERRLPLARGDGVLLPLGSAHALKDAPETGASPFDFDPRPEHPVPDVSAHGGGEPCRLVCGQIFLRGHTAVTLREVLPRILHVPSDHRRTASLNAIMRQMATEAFSQAPGASAILDGLARLLFIYALRFAIEEGGQTGILAALAHRGMRRALRAIHSAPNGPWTVDTLAREAHMSRSAFAETFAQTVGQPPATYLRAHRLSLACRLLQESHHGLETVAEEVGYGSMAAFSKAFKRTYGKSPGDWRRTASIDPREAARL